MRLLSDQALDEGGNDRSDGLGFGAYAGVLHRAALGTTGPFTIGIFGEWGTGKTSLMRMVKKRLDEGREHTLTIWFNAWQYEREEHAIVPLIGTIIQALEDEKNQGFKARLGEAGKKVVRALRALIYGFSLKGTLKVPGAELSADFNAAKAIDREKELDSPTLAEQSLYYTAFETLEAIHLPEGMRVVVMIDDLDRCLPDKALKLLEAIKLVLGQRGFIFMLGVARTVLEGYLEHKYKAEFGIPEFDGKAYLDKMVQLAFNIPSHSRRMEELAGKMIEGLTDDFQSKLRSVVPLIARHLRANPRALVRFVNSLLIDVEISRVVEQPVEPEYFAVSRLLFQRWPEFHSSVMANQRVATFAAQGVGDRWALTGIKNPDEKYSCERVAAMILADPDLAKLVAEEHCQHWLEHQQKRDRAVLYLKLQAQPAAPAKPAPTTFLPRDQVVLTVVAGNSPASQRMVETLREEERRFSGQHWTYPESNNEIKPQSERAAHIVVLELGNDQPGQARPPIAALAGKKYRLVNLPAPAPNDPQALRQTAAEFWRKIFGDSAVP